MSRLFLTLLSRPRLVLLVTLVLTAASVHFCTRLKLSTDLAELLPNNYDSVKTLEVAKEELGGFDNLHILLQGADVKTLIAWGHRLEEALLARRDVRMVQFRKDVEFFEAHALLYAETEKLTELRDALEERIRQEKLKNNPLYIDLDDEEPASSDSLDDELKELEETYSTDDEDLYRIDPKGKFVVLTVYSALKSSNVGTARRFHQNIAQLVHGMATDGLFAEYTGNLKNKVDQYDVIISDVGSSAAISLSIVFLLIVIYFRSISAAAVISLALIASVAWTFAITYFAIGELNIMTVFLFVVLFGLGIDYGIHLLARHMEQRRAGDDAQQALKTAVSRCLRPLLATALTTSVAFFSLLIADFRGFSHFGFIAGTGVLASFFATVFVLPALVSVAERWNFLGRQATRQEGRFPSSYRFAAPILGVTAATVVAGGMAIGGLSLEYDFSELRPELSEVRAVKDKMNRVSTGESNSPAIVMASSLEHLRQVAQVVDETKAPTFDKFRSMADLIPARQEEKLALIADIRELASESGFDGLEGDAGRRVERLRRLASVSAPLRQDDLPPSVGELFRTRDGGGVGFVYPSVELKDGRNAVAFADDLRQLAVDAKLSLVPSNASVVFADMLQAIVREGATAVVLTALALLLMTFMTLRSVAGSLLAVLPLGVGCLWLALAMALGGLKFNFFNIVVIPSVLGIGIDSGIHLYHRYRAEGVGGVPVTLRTTGGAVLVSSLTTMVGFFGMVFATHPGLRSIGTLAVLGISAVLVASFTSLPALLVAMEKRKTVSGHPD